MDSLEISNISGYEDYMMTTSNDEELPGLEEVPYWTLVCLNTYLTLNLQYIALNLIHNCLNIDWDIYWNTNLPFLYSHIFLFKDDCCCFICHYYYYSFIIFISL